MKDDIMLRAVAVLLMLFLLLSGGAGPLSAASRVEQDNGLVSAEFDGTPVPEALDAIRGATGVEIVVPASVRDKSLTLTVERAPFEQFVRRVLDGLDLGGFALVYEASGAAQRVIVVDRARGGGVEPAATEPVPPAGAGAGPVYIPPATPPVYIPPSTPPVYIPPATPPMYIPPATPPVYIPPATEP